MNFVDLDSSTGELGLDLDYNSVVLNIKPATIRTRYGFAVENWHSLVPYRVILPVKIRGTASSGFETRLSRYQSIPSYGLAFAIENWQQLVPRR